MRLKLTNFKCYEETEFNFGTIGLVLLEGPSGSGKSSIFHAINFALYDIGTKIISFGKTSCKVEFEFQDICIIRTKRPNRLIVNDIYEGLSAQSIINKKFGNTFDIAGYMCQNTINSFIFMSPLEKLNFMEKFAFSDIELETIKLRCKTIIKEKNEMLIHTTSQLEMAIKIIEEKPIPTKIIFPIKCSVKNQDIVAKNEHIHLKNTIVLVKKLNKHIQKILEEKQHLELMNIELQIKEEQISKLTEELNILEKEKSLTLYEGDEKLEEYQQQLEIIITSKEMQILEQTQIEDLKRINIMKENETSDLKNSILKLKDSLWLSHSKIETETMIQEYKSMIKDIHELHNLNKTLEQFKTNTTDYNKNNIFINEKKPELISKKELLKNFQLQQEIYTCPSCQSSLKFDETSTNLININFTPVPNIKKNINMKDLEYEISILENTISQKESDNKHIKNKKNQYDLISQKIQDINSQYDEPLLLSIKEGETELEYIQNYKHVQVQTEKQIDILNNKLNNNQFSASYINFVKIIQQNEQKIKMFISKNKKSLYNEENLRIIIQNQQKNKEILERLSNQIINISEQIKLYTNRINYIKNNHINKFKKIRDVNNLEKITTKKIKEIQILELNKQIHSENITKLEKYNIYIQEAKEYDIWKQKISILQQEEIEYKKQYAAIIELKEKIIEAESISISNIIETINTHVHIYLEKFFPENPINIQLLAFKETKKLNKPQINLSIEYKGMEADINMLSGGEKARIVLSFTLALADMFNTPLILLDESTSSLDSELTGEIIEGIKEISKDKLIIMVCHQVLTKAQFDNVIVL